MSKQRIARLVISLIVILTLFSGLALSINAVSAQRASVHPILACGGVAFPPCEAPVY
jgi:hypothetical protein